MRRELAVYTEKDDLLFVAWIEESRVDEFTAERRKEGFRVVDVQLSGRFLDPDSTGSYDRLSHILRNQ